MGALFTVAWVLVIAPAIGVGIMGTKGISYEIKQHKINQTKITQNDISSEDYWIQQISKDASVK